MHMNARAFSVLVLDCQVNDTTDEIARLKHTAWSRPEPCFLQFPWSESILLNTNIHSQGAMESPSPDQFQEEGRDDNCMSFSREVKLDNPFLGSTSSSLHLSRCGAWPLGLVEQPCSVGASGTSGPWSSQEKSRGCWRWVELGEAQRRGICVAEDNRWKQWAQDRLALFTNVSYWRTEV